MLWRSVAVVGVLCAGCAVEAPRLEGPMPTRSQHPAQLTVMRLVPKDTVTGGAGHVDAGWTNAYSSLFLGGENESGSNRFVMDGEYWRTALRARIGLGAGFELDFELPFGLTTGGFLDDFVIAWHDFWGFKQYGRDEAPRDQYQIRAEVAGSTAWSVDEASFELLDVPLSLSWSFAEAREPGSWGAALRAGLELPTGDDDRGFGSGELDWSVGAIGEYRGHRWGVTVHAEHTFAGQPSQALARGLPFEDVTSAGIGGEYAIADDWAAVVQVEWETSTLRSMGFARVADDELNLWAGVRVAVADRTRIELALGEDLAEFIAPDFTIWLAVYHAIGAAR